VRATASAAPASASRRRSLDITLGLAALAGALAALGLVASPAAPALASYGPPGKPEPNPAVAVPLSGSVTTSATTWATVVMGKNDGNFDLFWQLFSLSARTGRFSLVTPPGVADNGGLMVAPDGTGTTALVGMGASQGLTFSPLALTANSGRTWSQGGLPDALVAAPSVVGLDASGSALALVGGGSPAVLERSGSLTSWKTLVTRAALGATPAGKTCAIGSLEAVALDAHGTALVGASCREPYVPGVFVDSDAQWHLADIPVPAALADDAFAVLRLQGASALLAAVHGTTTSVVATWQPTAGRPWVLSAPLRLGSAKDLLASGTGPGTTQFVLVRGAGKVRAVVVAGPGAAWRALPSLPAATATIADEPDGRLEALSVDVTRLTVWRLGATRQSWSKVQSIVVPIAFGSSS
jgi:hypothetical protein